MRGWGGRPPNRRFQGRTLKTSQESASRPRNWRQTPHAAAHMLDAQFGQASDFGKVRTNNEDAMGFFIPASRQQARSHGYLFAVADGVGGLDLGEVASATAISVMTEQFAKAQPGAMLISLLPRLIQQANAAVHDRSSNPDTAASRWPPRSSPAPCATTRP